LTFPLPFLTELYFMASGDLDVPQILAGMPDARDNLFSSALSHSSPLLDSSRVPPSSDNHGSPSSPTPSPILRSARNSLGSIRWATSTALYDNNHDERDESSSYAPNFHNRRQRIGGGSSTHSERAVEDNRRFKLLTRAAHPDWTSQTRVAHVDASLDAGTSAGSRSSFITSFFRKTVRRVRRPSGESHGGSDKGSHPSAKWWTEG
jgi:hypothetical protein